MWFLKLRTIMDIFFVPSVARQQLQLLAVLIDKYLQQKIRFFPNQTIKKNHHHMIHYPRLIMQSGPMLRMWCMRFEQKHQRYKRLVHEI